jgi:hypothetical protein
MNLDDILSSLCGGRIPGGCDHCDAYQTNEQVDAGIWRLTVHHDDWCPWLATHRRPTQPTEPKENTP